MEIQTNTSKDILGLEQVLENLEGNLFTKLGEFKKPYYLTKRSTYLSTRVMEQIDTFNQIFPGKLQYTGDLKEDTKNLIENTYNFINNWDVSPAIKKYIINDYLCKCSRCIQVYFDRLDFIHKQISEIIHSEISADEVKKSWFDQTNRSIAKIKLSKKTLKKSLETNYHANKDSSDEFLLKTIPAYYRNIFPELQNRV